ncbi:GNAT family N-acetyltransferase [Actinomyces wuliandei]|uniref:GNAT family N-acetyltransferase n=1 Tax=Actinomyces wuliandei TaxID=2057743 RepID=UPI000FD70F3D|nr:GNAT family N-acetyltransferase [Actinomyces wuliandei]
MTLVSRLRRRGPEGTGLVPVAADRVGGLLGLCGTEPVQATPLAHQVQRWSRWGRGDVVVAGDPQAPVGAAWTTGVAMPFGLAPRPGTGHGGVARSTLLALAEHTRPRLGRHGSVVGVARDVAALWEPLRRLGAVPREERWNQPLLRAPASPGGEGLVAGQRRRRPALGWVAQGLHAATRREEPLVMPASVAMFTAEVGYDPTTTGSSYARHVSWLVSTGRSYVVLDDGTGAPARPGSAAMVAFKADVGSVWHSARDHVAMLTGVWTRPDLRGRGVGAVATAAVVDAVRRDHVGPQGTVSLYVNDFNAPALALYCSVGFTQVDTFATVLL